MNNAKKLGLEKYPVVKRELAKDYYIDVFEKERVAFNQGYEAGYSDGHDDGEETHNESVWQSFRREAAKDILCALTGNKDYLKVIGRIEPETMLAVRFADELIKQLKEK